MNYTAGVTVYMIQTVTCTIKIENNKGTGYYITNGKAEEITWSKGGLTDNTKYYDASGNEIKINIGKTYIALVPDDAWGDLVVE